VFVDVLWLDVLVELVEVVFVVLLLLLLVATILTRTLLLAEVVEFVPALIEVGTLEVLVLVVVFGLVDTAKPWWSFMVVLVVVFGLVGFAKL